MPITLELKYGPMTPMRQSLEASCVPTSVSMVLSGFGIDLNERDLIEQYFPTAALKATNINAGVSNQDLVKGLVRILSDLEVRNRLQVDAFIPHYWEFSSSSNDRFIIPSDPSAAAREKRVSKGAPDLAEFNATLEQLAKKHDIGIYSGNKRLIQSQIIGRYHTEPDRNIHEEVLEWMREGHCIGAHGGLTLHVWAVDGFQSTERGFYVNDPARGTYRENPNVIIHPDYIGGLRKGWFDFVVRVSDRKPEPQTGFDRSRAWQNFKNRVAFWG